MAPILRRPFDPHALPDSGHVAKQSATENGDELGMKLKAKGSREMTPGSAEAPGDG